MQTSSEDSQEKNNISTTETDNQTPQAENKDEFKFTIDADDDEDDEAVESDKEET